MTLVLHIERIVLDGLPVTAAQLPALRAALERELGALLTAQPLRADALSALAETSPRPPSTRGQSSPHAQIKQLMAPRLQLRAGLSTEALGSRIAQAVHGSLGGPR